jgi:hypothetical protein
MHKNRIIFNSCNSLIICFCEAWRTWFPNGLRIHLPEHCTVYKMKWSLRHPEVSNFIVTKVKCKGKSCPCSLSEHHAMKTYWGSWGLTLRILDLGTRRRWVASFTRPGRFASKERAPGTYCVGGWVGLRAGLDTVVKRKIPNLIRDSNHRSSSPQPSAVPLSYLGSLLWLKKRTVS